MHMKYSSLLQSLQQDQLIQTKQLPMTAVVFLLALLILLSLVSNPAVANNEDWGLPIAWGQEPLGKYVKELHARLAHNTVKRIEFDQNNDATIDSDFEEEICTGLSEYFVHSIFSDR